MSEETTPAAPLMTAAEARNRLANLPGEKEEELESLEFDYKEKRQDIQAKYRRRTTVLKRQAETMAALGSDADSEPPDPEALSTGL